MLYSCTCASLFQAIRQLVSYERRPAFTRALRIDPWQNPSSSLVPSRLIGARNGREINLYPFLLVHDSDQTSDFRPSQSVYAAENEEGREEGTAAQTIEPFYGKKQLLSAFETFLLRKISPSSPRRAEVLEVPRDSSRLLDIWLRSRNISIYPLWLISFLPSTLLALPSRPIDLFLALFRYARRAFDEDGLLFQVSPAFGARSSIDRQLWQRSRPPAPCLPMKFCVTSSLERESGVPCVQKARTSVSREERDISARGNERTLRG